MKNQFSYHFLTREYVLQVLVCDEEKDVVFSISSQNKLVGQKSYKYNEFVKIGKEMKPLHFLQRIKGPYIQIKWDQKRPYSGIFIDRNDNQFHIQFKIDKLDQDKLSGSSVGPDTFLYKYRLACVQQKKAQEKRQTLELEKKLQRITKEHSLCVKEPKPNHESVPDGMETYISPHTDLIKEKHLESKVSHCGEFDLCNIKIFGIREIISMDFCAYIKNLQLENNYLTSKALEVLTRRCWDKLKILTLTRNEITDLTWNTQNIKFLIALSLSNNFIRVLSDNIKDFPDLQRLDISRNYMKEINPKLTQLPELKNLWIEENQIPKIEENQTFISLKAKVRGGYNQRLEEQVGVEANQSVASSQSEYNSEVASEVKEIVVQKSAQKTATVEEVTSTSITEK